MGSIPAERTKIKKSAVPKNSEPLYDFVAVTSGEVIADKYLPAINQLVANGTVERVDEIVAL